MAQIGKSRKKGMEGFTSLLTENNIFPLNIWDFSHIFNLSGHDMTVKTMHSNILQIKVKQLLIAYETIGISVQGRFLKRRNVHT